VGLGALYCYRKSAAVSQKPAVLLRWGSIAIIALISIGLIGLSVGWLLSIADSAATQIDAIKTALGMVAGCGAAIALLVAVRRQWHQEIATNANVLDATEQRVTELYSKAVDQLGSPDLSVRLGGIYSLERLAHDHVNHRQTILYMLCACLRMLDKDSLIDGRDSRDGRMDDPRIFQLGEDEREMQAAVVDILRRHRDRIDTAGVFWAARGLDLRGANLGGCNLSGMNLAFGRYMRTQLTNANLQHVKFAGANMTGAVLNGSKLVLSDLSSTILRSAQLKGVDLTGAKLTAAKLDDAVLHGAILSGVIWNEYTTWPSSIEAYVAASSSVVDQRRFQVARGVQVPR
jgi:hypothetical protein